MNMMGQKSISAYKSEYCEAKKGKCLVSCYPIDPTILGPTQTFLKTFGILKSIFRLILRIFILFPFKKALIKKKGLLAYNDHLPHQWAPLRVTC